LTPDWLTFSEDGAKGRITLPGRKTKNGKPRAGPRRDVTWIDCRWFEVRKHGDLWT
jgi:hypothetical protein